MGSPSGVHPSRKRLYKVSDASKEMGVLGEMHDEEKTRMRKKEKRKEEGRSTSVREEKGGG